MRWRILILLLCVFLNGCKKQTSIETPSYPVSYAEVEKKDIPFFIEAIGTLAASDEVDIKAQVNGILEEVLFEDGQYVEKGMLLLKIDARSYEAQLKIAEATLKQDIAKLNYAKDYAKTYGRLVQNDYVARLDFSRGIQDLEVAEATIDSDEASIENAKINLGYTQIRAPMSGYAGLNEFDPGNYIQADGQTVLLTIKKVSPLKVNFSVPSQWVQDIREKQKTSSICLECFLSEDNHQPLRGKLSFVDNTVDNETGMIVLEGMLPNKNEEGWPGQFVTVKLLLDTIKNSIVIPSVALQIGESDYFVFVLKEDMTVEMRNVEPGIHFKNEYIITKGLQVGEKVITDGQINLVNGSKVFVSEYAPQNTFLDVEK